MKILIIDDSQERHDGLSKEYNKIIDENVVIHHAWSYDSSINLLGENTYDLICFDHDLNDIYIAGKQVTGESVAWFIVANYMKCGAARVHSHNVEGAKNIISILRSGEVTDNVYYEPFALIPGCDMKGLKEQANAEGDKEDTNSHT
jgi:hypothetical protein